MPGTNEISSEVLLSIPIIHFCKGLIKLRVSADRALEIIRRLESLKELSDFFLVQIEAYTTMTFANLMDSASYSNIICKKKKNNRSNKLLLELIIKIALFYFNNR